MRIGWDAKRAFLNHTGLGVYSRNIIHALSSILSNDQFVLFSPKSPSGNVTILENTQICTPQNFIARAFHSLWRSFLIGHTQAYKSLDIYHGLSGEIPFFTSSKVKKIVTIHDILFERFPEDYPFIDRLFYRYKAKYATMYAEKIVAVSEATKQDLIDYYHIPESKIKVIPNTFEVKNPHGTILQAPFKKPFVIFVSTFIGRKNQLLLAQAFNQIASKVSYDLILIGSGRAYYKKVISEVSQMSYKDRIHFIPTITEAELVWYYQNALFSIYPSQYEGFGIPVLESIAYQCPVLISNVAPLREVGGDAAYYFISNDVEDLGKRMLEMPLNRSVDKAKCQLQLEKYDSKKIHFQLIELYKETIG